MLVASTGQHLLKCLVPNTETMIISLYRKKNERSRIWDRNFQLAHKIKIVRIATTCHSGNGFSYFSYYGNTIVYNERVEIGGDTIQFYHKLEQSFKSYCHRYIGIFVYNPMGGVKLLYTKMRYPFIFNGGLQIFIYL